MRIVYDVFEGFLPHTGTHVLVNGRSIAANGSVDILPACRSVATNVPTFRFLRFPTILSHKGTHVDQLQPTFQVALCQNLPRLTKLLPRTPCRCPVRILTDTLPDTALDNARILPDTARYCQMYFHVTTPRIRCNSKDPMFHLFRESRRKRRYFHCFLFHIFFGYFAFSYCSPSPRKKRITRKRQCYHC